MYSLSSCHLKLFYTACFIAGVFKAYSADSLTLLEIVFIKGCDPLPPEGLRIGKKPTLQQMR